MAYVPPHKRHSKDSPKPSPVPSSVIPQFKQALTLGGGSKPNSRRRQDRHQSSSNPGFKIIYATNSIARWFTAGSAGDDPVPSSVRLEPFDCEVFERRNDAKPLVLRGGEDGEIEERPWVKIAERVVPDLVDCSQTAIEGLESEREVIKLSVVARVGKVLFLGYMDPCKSLQIVPHAASPCAHTARAPSRPCRVLAPPCAHTVRARVSPHNNNLRAQGPFAWPLCPTSVPVPYIETTLETVFMQKHLCQ